MELLGTGRRRRQIGLLAFVLLVHYRSTPPEDARAMLAQSENVARKISINQSCDARGALLQRTGSTTEQGTKYKLFSTR